MRRILILIHYKKSINKVILILFIICVSALIFFIGLNPFKYTHVMNTIETDQISKLKEENLKLKKILKSILPNENAVIYEDKYRNRLKAAENVSFSNFKFYPLAEVLQKGSRIHFSKLFNAHDYERPLYKPEWKNAYYRGWVYLPQKIIEARHNLFVFSHGLSYNFDLVGSLGFNKNISIDPHRHINFLVYNFNVNNIKKFKQQIVLVGEPKKTGVEVISIKLRDAMPKDKDIEKFLFQLATPGGYEIDYLYHKYEKSEYYKRLEEWETTEYVFAEREEEVDIDQLKEENMILKNKLSKILPIKEDTITKQKCRETCGNIPSNNSKFQSVMEKGKEIPYEINYRNPKYERPVFHPLWKEYYQKGWSYIPLKICENLHNLFPIPQDPKKRTDFFGSLAFSEDYIPVESSEYGILVYNYIIDKVLIHNNNIVISGQPARTGAEIISIGKSSLIPEERYVVWLITNDVYEIDCAVLKQ